MNPDNPDTPKWAWPADFTKRDLIRYMIADSSLRGSAQEIGLVLCGAKPAAYLMSYYRTLSFDRILAIIEDKGWAVFCQFLVPHHEIVLGEGETIVGLENEEEVALVISSDASRMTELKGLVECRFDETTNPELVERLGLLLGYPAASAYWYAYHPSSERPGDTSCWSLMERCFSNCTHPQDLELLAQARLWSGSQAEAFNRAYGEDALDDILANCYLSGQPTTPTE
jgi:hypothetical protein